MPFVFCRQAVNVDDLRRRLPITPAEMRKKLVDVYGLSFDESMLIVVSLFLSEMLVEWFLWSKLRIAAVNLH